MISVFLYAFNAISPILLLVLLGYFLKEKHVFSQEFFKTTNTFSFQYAFPCMMFINIYNINSIRDINWRLAGFLLISIFIITIISLVITNLTTKVKNRKGVLVQAGFRSNFAVIAVPLAEGLVGAEGLAVVSSMQAPVVIYFNIVSVLALAAYSDDAKFDFKVVLKNIAKNPLIRGICAAVIALIIREFIPLNADGTLVFSIKNSLPWVYTTLNYMNRMGTPLCLIALGGLFSASDVPGIKKELIVACFMRLVMAPAIGFALAFAAQSMGFITLEPAIVATLVAVFGSPIAVSSAAMASQMKGDGILAGQIVVWTSLCSMVTIFLMTVVFRYAGLL